ncbi:MAG: hypothetical protein ABL986_15070 [Vicinamibacterales bacterium]
MAQNRSRATLPFLLVALAIASACAPAVVQVQRGAATAPTATTGGAFPRTPDGRPDLQGIWQARSRASYGLHDHAARAGMPAALSAVVEGDIPYQAWAAARQRENFDSRTIADPLAQCYMPGVPRIMYMEWPFQIFQTRDQVAMTFEWQHLFRLIYTNGTRPPEGLEFWMGDSRGRWDGDTLVVDVTNHNARTWLDMAGNFHSEALHVIERYTMLEANTLQYEARIEDAKVFTRPWTIRVRLERQVDSTRLMEYPCRAEIEEARCDFEPDPRTWYVPARLPAVGTRPTVIPPRLGQQAESGVDGRRPDLSGLYLPDRSGGANWGLEPHPSRVELTPVGTGVVIDPTDRLLPYQAWARQEQQSRNAPERGYDDPTAHCFVAAGVPRSMYVPSPLQVIQTPTHVVFLFERMAWRIVPLDGRPHISDAIRLWNGDSVGRWDDDTLIVETTNLNGKTWLNEVGDVVSHAETVVERFTRIGAGAIRYEATVTDPLVYTRPWTIAFTLERQTDELLEAACLEDNQDLQHLKELKDAARQGTASRSER